MEIIKNGVGKEAPIDFKMDIGLDKTKEGIYILTKNRIRAACPFQFPSMGQNLSGQAVQTSQACQSLCAKFEITNQIADENLVGAKIVDLNCGIKQTYIVDNENINNV